MQHLAEGRGFTADDRLNSPSVCVINETFATRVFPGQSPIGQRTPEIGIRMALGATRRQVVGLVMRSGLVLVGIGLLLGIGGATAASRLIRQQLFGVEPLNAWFTPRPQGCSRLWARSPALDLPCARHESIRS